MLMFTLKKKINVYGNLQVDVNTHYFPGMFLSYSLEEKEKGHPEGKPFSVT